MMKKLLLFMLSAAFALTMTAGNVTPDEALGRASDFVRSRVMNGHGPLLAPGAGVQLSLASQMEGLYVFNVAADGGFVIVSGDDRAVPILGYADSGSFDPEHMPDNMRAWLQGYCDEVASLDRRSAAAAPAMAPSAAKEPVVPLIQTHWDQNEPYNNLCPKYTSTKRSVTGCVATAVAQAMYYTETKAGNATTTTIAEIPSYSPSVGYQPAIPAGTEIRWGDMQLSYNGSETAAQKLAVAQIMYWIGVAVQTEYGSTSSSTTINAAHALTAYFGYHTTTTKAVMSSWYTYADWLEMLYNELRQGRPVVYGGQSSGGGHEFILDGYQTEDYFHVNWGWGGTSDGYFKLSALDPDVQGTGGSTSTDGYHYGHDAIVGLQKPEGTGTVVGPEPFYAFTQLTVNSISVSPGATVNKWDDVTFTVSITNPTSQDYDGDVCVSAAGVGLLSGDMFHIGAGETKDCVIPWVAKGYTGTGTIRVSLPNNEGTYSWTSAWPTTTLTIKAVPGSDAVELALSVVAENAESTGGTISYSSSPSVPVYNLYDNTYRATLTLTNSSPNNYSGYYACQLVEKWAGYSYSLEEVYVPAGSSKDIVVEVKNLNPAKDYLLMATYVKNGSYSPKYLQCYKLQPVIVAYADDGTKTVTKPAASYNVPANVLSVDLRGTGVTSVTPNSEPNCLYILNASDAVPSGLTNVVKYHAGAYTADAIALSDDYGFYSPVDFTATNVEFTYNNAKQADGMNGWNTLVLPFDATKVTADGTEMSWFKSASEKGKNFWLKEFTSDETGKVYFSFAQDLKANTPYIVALPGDHWGSAWDLSGKTIKFVGENVTVTNGDTRSIVTGSAYRFIGSTKAVGTGNIYVMNAAGNKFELKTTGGSTPFRAFFKADTFDNTLSSLGIGADDGETTGIEAVENRQQEKDGEVYNLNGQRILQPQKGIYIMTGKKIIKK